MHDALSAPIAVMGYDRPDALATAVASLTRCSGFAGRRVHLFCDAPEGPGSEAGVAQVRELARSFCDHYGARLVLRTQNLGFRNITQAMSELCSEHGCAVSIEDDLVLAPGFLSFIDGALATYAKDPRVFHVSGYTLGGVMPTAPTAFFLPVPMPWGWATWERAWRRFTWEAEGASRVLENPMARRAFDLDGAYPAAALLERTLAGRFESYFIRWYLAMFLAGGLALCPRVSLVENRGASSGVHARQGAGLDRRRRYLSGSMPDGEKPAPAKGLTWPRTVAVDAESLTQLRSFLGTLRGRAAD
ncbi:MAG: hypothetical protein JNJ46_12775 [Myxococcales bacterium]|nr:hypothetical protein [Myxococcales bacterium]